MVLFPVSPNARCYRCDDVVIEAAILENSNGDISAVDRPIYSVFGSRMGFSGSADQMAIFPVLPNPRWRLGHHLGKFKWRYLSGGSSDLLRVWF